MTFSNSSRNKTRPQIDFQLICGVLGAFTFFAGVSLLLPALFAWIFDEMEIWVFLGSSVSAMIIGSALYFIFKPKYDTRPREAFIIVSLTWVVFTLVGALPFYFSGILYQFTDAFFETMSGLTTTGATIFGGSTAEGIENPLLESLPKSILFWRSMLHWVGGMGFIVLSIAILPFLGLGGVQLFQAESSVHESDKLTPRVRETAKLLWVVYVLFTAVHFVLLWIHPKMDWFDALNHAMSTLATGGFSTKDSSIAWFNSAYIDFVIIIFMYLAGISFAMHFRLLRGETKSFFNNRETRFYTIVVLLAVFLTSGSLWIQGGHDFGDALRFGSFQALSILTTTGYGTHDYTQWPGLAMVVIMILFFTGACAGSTSGGVKMFRHMVMFRAIGREIRQGVHPRAVIPLRIGPRVIPPQVISKILSFLILYLILFLAGGLLLTIGGIDPLSALSASIASLGSIGPAFGEFGPTSNYAALGLSGKWILSFLMLLGRLELFTLLIIFSIPFWRE